MTIFFKHVAGLVGIALLMAGCGPTAQPRPVMPEAQYAVFARSLALIEYCYAQGRISAEDTVGLRQQTRANLGQYQFDAATINAMTQASLAGGPQVLADPGYRRGFEQNCAEMARTAATNRVTNQQNAAVQLQQAQLAAAYAQREAALTPTYVPQPYVMAPMPTFQPPQVQTPVFGGNRSTVFCNRLTDTITTCR
jgi:hypothetical protein